MVLYGSRHFALRSSKSVASYYVPGPGSLPLLLMSDDLNSTGSGLRVVLVVRGLGFIHRLP